MVDIVECPVCQSRTLTPHRLCKDFTVSHETFPVIVCAECSLGITTPRPDTEKLGDYYRSEEYISHSGKSSGLMGPLYKTARSFALNWKTRLIRTYQKNGSALDFGCGTGEFLSALKNQGWTIAGVEPSSLARTKAQNHTGEKIFTAVTEIPEQPFDVITAWHVIEHVPDLQQTIASLRQHLKKDGTIFIAVPNYESPDAQKYKDYWAAYDVPRHLWHFSKKSMTQLLQSNGLKVQEILPMKLDAFYVSMLSENYLNSNTASMSTMLRGFLSGMRSNMKAGSDNFSSLIYIARHV